MRSDRGRSHDDQRAERIVHAGRAGDADGRIARGATGIRSARRPNSTTRSTKPVRLLGEDLVLYKDLSGTYGLIERHCPHRRADLAHGIVETCGIRCHYHGWMFGADGQCLEQPFEDTAHPDRHFRDKVTARRLSGRGEGGASLGLSRARARAAGADLGDLHLDKRLPPDRVRRYALQLAAMPGELHRSGAFRMDARELDPAAERRRRRLTGPSISSSNSRNSITGSSTSACARASTRRMRNGPSGAWRCGRTASISAAISNGACRWTTRTR